MTPQAVHALVSVHVSEEKTLSALAKQDFSVHYTVCHCGSLVKAVIVYQKTKLLNAWKNLTWSFLCHITEGICMQS